jgi:endonuclease YncB( thermonuclease family)
MARVAVIDTDRYGRSVGVVQCAGVDANKSMVAGGFAWVYRKYVPKDSELFALETKARGEKIGLWVDASPTPPWDFRRLGDNG